MTAQSNFVSTQWLADNLGKPDIAVIDGSFYLPTMNRNAEAEYAAAHIPGAVRFDIDTVKDAANPLPHMVPPADVFAKAAGAMGISEDMTIVVYDGAGLFGAPRVWWLFKNFGARNVFILEGGFPAWQAEGQPVTAEVPKPQPRMWNVGLQGMWPAVRNALSPPPLMACALLLTEVASWSVIPCRILLI